METETIDKLFLELAQFTRAKTARELELERNIASWMMLAKRRRTEGGKAWIKQLNELVKVSGELLINNRKK